MMTSSTGRQIDSASPILDDDVIAALKKRELRHAQIIDGALPTYQELLSGLPLRHDDLQSDVMAAIDDWKVKRSMDETLRQALVSASEAARSLGDHDSLLTLYDELDLSRSAISADSHLFDRVCVWLAYLGAEEAIDRSVSAAMFAYRWTQTGVEGAFRIAWAVGLKLHRPRSYEPGVADMIGKRGIANLVPVGDLISPLAEMSSNSPSGLAALISKQRPSSTSDEDWESAVGASLDVLLGDVKEDDDDADGLIVVPVMPEGIGGQKEVRKSWQGLAGKSLPLVDRGDVAGHRAVLVARYPHASDVIDTVLSDLATREEVRFRPTLLVGAPGSGKTSLLRAIAEAVGLPVELNSLAGSTDSSSMGTSAQWSTVRESVPLQLIKRSGQASVAIIWDEIEKASKSRHNGSVLDALLPMLEVDQARRYRDLALEVEVDLSMVSHFATANSIAAVPAPLRDRFRILTMPEPTWQHLGTLSRQIIDRIAKERAIDPRFFGDLAEDEKHLVRLNWPGGSLRQLTRIVTTIIDNRDCILPRC